MTTSILLLSSDDSNVLLLWLLYAAGIILCIFLTRAIFSIPRFLQYQKAQTRLLALLAVKHNADYETVSKIIEDIDSEMCTVIKREAPLKNTSTD